MLALFFAALLAYPPTDLSLLTAPIAQAADITPQQRWLTALERCESKRDPDAAVVDTNGYWSRGILQFQLATWLTAGKKYGIETSRENIFDQALQEEVATHMLDDGGWGHWYHCASAVQNELGAWPVGVE